MQQVWRPVAAGPGYGWEAGLGVFSREEVGSLLSARGSGPWQHVRESSLSLRALRVHSLLSVDLSSCAALLFYSEFFVSPCECCSAICVALEVRGIGSVIGAPWSAIAGMRLLECVCWTVFAGVRLVECVLVCWTTIDLPAGSVCCECDRSATRVRLGVQF